MLILTNQPTIFGIKFIMQTLQKQLLLAKLNALRRSLNNSCNIAEWTEFTIDKIIAACHKLKPDKKDAD